MIVVGSSSDVAANVLGCDQEVSEFEIQSGYYVHFRTNTLGEGMSPIISPALGQIASLLFCKKKGFSIK